MEDFQISTILNIWNILNLQVYFWIAWIFTFLFKPTVCSKFISSNPNLSQGTSKIYHGQHFVKLKTTLLFYSQCWKWKTKPTWHKQPWDWQNAWDWRLRGQRSGKSSPWSDVEEVSDDPQVSVGVQRLCQHFTVEAASDVSDCVSNSVHPNQTIQTPKQQSTDKSC